MLKNGIPSEEAFLRILRTLEPKQFGVVFEQRYYISSRTLSAEALAAAVRAHCGVENRLH